MASSVYARVAVHAEQQLYYKEFRPRGPEESLKALLRGSRATRARKNGEALLQAGFNAPVNVAWGKLPNRREYLYTAAAPGQGITQWLRQTLVERSGEQLLRRRQLLRALGAFIGRLHASGFIHGDLRPGKVLASLEMERFHFTLIDNERNVQKTPPPGRMLLRNLMQLNMLLPADLSGSDRLRFFSAWRRQMPDLSRLEARILGTESYHWAMRRLSDKGQL